MRQQNVGIDNLDFRTERSNPARSTWRSELKGDSRRKVISVLLSNTEIIDEKCSKYQHYLFRILIKKVTSSLKSNLTTYPAWPEHKKVISKGDGNKFMRHSHFCQVIDELHLTLIRD